jgi:bifunctional ADP-heptose synthase (sugar kinase/adenylyltransferase)
VPYKQTQL